MSIRLLPPDVLRLEAWNLLGKYDGHYTVWYREETNSFVFAKHGDYGNLVSYRDVDNPVLRTPDPDDEKFFRPRIDRTLGSAVMYDYYAKEPKFALKSSQTLYQEGKRVGYGYHGNVFEAEYPRDIEEIDKQAVAALWGAEIEVINHIYELSYGN